jgi:hypothetical protein
VNKLIDQVFRDKAGNVVVWQWPNLYLWAWLASVGLGLVLKGTAHTIASTIGTVALLVWASREAAKGKSLFRRLLGVAVAIATLAKAVVGLWH